MTPHLLTSRLVLDVAPSTFTSSLLDRVGARRVVRMDFDPAADQRDVNLRASLTRIPLPSASVDLMICFHVLEHVPDDASALGEIGRVLSSGGLALVQVPWRPGLATDEDPSAPAPERVRRFGQADHVRYYGGDFEDRLVASGLHSLRVTPNTLVGARSAQRFGLRGDDAVWLLRRPGAGSPAARVLGSAADPASERPAVDEVFLRDVQDDLDKLQAELDGERALLVAERAARAHWESSYRRLRSRWPLRAAAAVRGRLSRG
jgi:SAM-dependent methyltransferase